MNTTKLESEFETAIENDDKPKGKLCGRKATSSEMTTEMVSKLPESKSDGIDWRKHSPDNECGECELINETLR